MRSEYVDEVLHAVFHAIRVNQTLISRRMIEHRILDEPYLYPALHTQSPISRRSKISLIMNSHFSRWKNGQGVSQNTFVWKIRDDREVSRYDI